MHASPSHHTAEVSEIGKYVVVPVRLRDANAFVAKWHRHNGLVDHRGHRFSIGLRLAGDGKEGELVGVAIAGQPIARANDDGYTLEVLRVCVRPGNPGANSMLYSRVRRIAQLMGYRRVITYTLAEESGASLRAVGATPTPIRVSPWSNKSRKRRDTLVTFFPKLRWEL